MRLAAKQIGLAGAAGVLIMTLGAAQRPSLFSRVSGGLWEVSGAPGAEEPVRMCIGNLARLAQFEHRQASCERNLIRDTAEMAEFHYSCAGQGFGRTTMRLVTPRSLRVETQGISGGAPFHYVLQARRVGDCRSH